MSKITHMKHRIHTSIGLGTAAFLLFVLALGQTLTIAQELPTFGKPLWTLDLDTIYSRGAIDYAAEKDLVFVGTKTGSIIVLDAKNGIVVHSFNVRSIPRYRYLTGVLDVYSVRCSRDGRTLAVGVTSRRLPRLTCDIFVLDYPSWRVVDTLLYSKSDPSEDPYQYSQFGISPSGRYLAMPDSSWREGVPDWTLPKMKLLDRSSGKSRVVTWSRFADVDFDSSESLIAYCEVVNTSRGYYGNYVRTLSMADEPSTPQGWDVYGTPCLSSDGSKLMVAGNGHHNLNEELDLLPHATVYDLKTRDTIWHLPGDRTGVGGDLVSASWSKDGKMVLTSRASRKLVPPEWHGFVMYRVGESRPFAKLDSNVWFARRFVAEDRAAVCIPDLTRGYVALNNNVFAVDYSLETTGAHDPGSAADDAIYPNPASSSVTVSCSSSSPAVAWGIYTNSGVMVAHGELDVNTDNENNTYNIQLPTGLAPSVYILVLQNTEGVKTCAYRVMTL